ncbi:SLC13 family permease [Poriferisphaera sp. WC338]|uniref:SLC13 family permease n=1 Tax=Poriferisphaera sp. WC338 TaxID=3425129 RepID=UPI003D81488A
MPTNTCRIILPALADKYSSTMTTAVIIIFVLVYIGLILGRIPGLRIGRTGIALLGAVAMLITGILSINQAWQSIDASTMILLFALMVISASFEQSGCYTLITSHITRTPVSPRTLLLIVILVTAALSAVLANDIVCLATTPILLRGITQRKLNPMPFLIALACAANIGSAATLIGNPQNILIGEALGVSFPHYFLIAILPVTVSLILTWLIIVALTPANSWSLQTQLNLDAIQTSASTQAEEHIYPLNLFRAVLTSTILIVLVLLFLFSPWHKPALALVGAALLLFSRKRATEESLNHIDWQLLLLFIALFIINAALAATGSLPPLVADLSNLGLDPQSPPVLYVLTAVLSNLVSNVPAVILILNIINDPAYGPLLALSSTLAGNFIIVGSIANIIVVTQADRLGFTINWKQHARIGIPVTLATLTVTAGWLYLLSILAT